MIHTTSRMRLRYLDPHAMNDVPGMALSSSSFGVQSVLEERVAL